MHFEVVLSELLFFVWDWLLPLFDEVDEPLLELELFPLPEELLLDEELEDPLVELLEDSRTASFTAFSSFWLE